MLEDLYATTRECVKALAAAGCHDEAAVLDRALYGATSGEILGDIAVAAKSIARGKSNLPRDLRDALLRLRSDADALLRPR